MLFILHLTITTTVIAQTTTLTDYEIGRNSLLNQMQAHSSGIQPPSDMTFAGYDPARHGPIYVLPEDVEHHANPCMVVDAAYRAGQRWFAHMNMSAAPGAERILPDGMCLSGAVLRGARIRYLYGWDGMDWSGADLTNADLRDSDLTGIDLRGTNLNGARLP